MLDEDAAETLEGARLRLRRRRSARASARARRALRAAGAGRRAGARPSRRPAHRAEPLRRRSALGPDPQRLGDRPARRRRGARALCPGPRRMAEADRARPLGLGDDAHRRRRPRSSLRADRLPPDLGHGVEPRRRLRNHAAGGARAAAGRRDPAHFRPLPRRLSEPDRALFRRGPGGRRMRRKPPRTIRSRPSGALRPRACSARRPAPTASASAGASPRAAGRSGRNWRKPISRRPATPTTARARAAKPRRRSASASRARRRSSTSRTCRDRTRSTPTLSPSTRAGSPPPPSASERARRSIISNSTAPGRAKGPHARAGDRALACAAAPPIRAGSPARCAMGIAARRRSPSRSTISTPSPP